MRSLASRLERGNCKGRVGVEKERKQLRKGPFCQEGNSLSQTSAGDAGGPTHSIGAQVDANQFRKLPLSPRSPRGARTDRSELLLPLRPHNICVTTVRSSVFPTQATPFLTHSAYLRTALS